MRTTTISPHVAPSMSSVAASSERAMVEVPRPGDLKKLDIQQLMSLNGYLIDTPNNQTFKDAEAANTLALQVGAEISRRVNDWAANASKPGSNKVIPDIVFVAYASAWGRDASNKARRAIESVIREKKVADLDGQVKAAVQSLVNAHRALETHRLSPNEGDVPKPRAEAKHFDDWDGRQPRLTAPPKDSERPASSSAELLVDQQEHQALIESRANDVALVNDSSAADDALPPPDGQSSKPGSGTTSAAAPTKSLGQRVVQAFGSAKASVASFFSIGRGRPPQDEARPMTISSPLMDQELLWPARSPIDEPSQALVDIQSSPLDDLALQPRADSPDAADGAPAAEPPQKRMEAAELSLALVPPIPEGHYAMQIASTRKYLEASRNDNVAIAQEVRKAIPASAASSKPPQTGGRGKSLLEGVSSLFQRGADSKAIGATASGHTATSVNSLNAALVPLLELRELAHKRVEAAEAYLNVLIKYNAAPAPTAEDMASVAHAHLELSDADNAFRTAAEAQYPGRQWDVDASALTEVAVPARSQADPVPSAGMPLDDGPSVSLDRGAVEAAAHDAPVQPADGPPAGQGNDLPDDVVEI